MMQEGIWCPKEVEEWRVTYMQFACRRVGNTRSGCIELQSKKYNTNLQNQAKGPPNRSTYVLHQGSTNQSFMVQEGNWCPKDAEEYLRYLLQFACQRARLVTAR